MQRVSPAAREYPRTSVGTAIPSCLPTRERWHGRQEHDSGRFEFSPTPGEQRGSASREAGACNRRPQPGRLRCPAQLAHGRPDLTVDVAIDGLGLDEVDWILCI